MAMNTRVHAAVAGVYGGLDHRDADLPRNYQCRHDLPISSGLSESLIRLFSSDQRSTRDEERTQGARTDCGTQRPQNVDTNPTLIHPPDDERARAIVYVNHPQPPSCASRPPRNPAPISVPTQAATDARTACA